MVILFMRDIDFVTTIFVIYYTKSYIKYNIK